LTRSEWALTCVAGPSCAKRMNAARRVCGGRMTAYDGSCAKMRTLSSSRTTPHATFFTFLAVCLRRGKLNRRKNETCSGDYVGDLLPHALLALASIYEYVDDGWWCETGRTGRVELDLVLRLFAAVGRGAADNMDAAPAAARAFISRNRVLYLTPACCVRPFFFACANILLCLAFLLFAYPVLTFVPIFWPRERLAV